MTTEAREVMDPAFPLTGDQCVFYDDQYGPFVPAGYALGYQEQISRLLSENAALRQSEHEAQDRASYCSGAMLEAQEQLAAMRERADGFEALLLRIGEMAHKLATDETATDLDRDSFCWTLRRWCGHKDELEEFLKERKELTK